MPCHSHLHILILSLVALSSACTPRQTATDPVSVMMDRTRAVEIRLQAARQVQARQPTDKSYQRALEELIRHPGHPIEIKQYAIDTKIAADESAAKAYLRRAIVQIEHWPTLEYICVTAVQRGWRDFIPALVRSAQRPSIVVPDHERPERAAILALAPNQSLELCVFGVFNAQTGPSVSERTSAWALLGRLTDSYAQRKAWLDRANSESIVVTALQAAADELGIIPTAREDVVWLTYLHLKQRELWREAIKVIAGLSSAQRVGIEPRHLPALGYLPVLDTQPDALRRQLGQSLTHVDHQLKVAPKAGSLPQHPQQFSDWAEQLSWGDLVVIQHIRLAMQDRKLVRAWFAQADADMKDADTEYGGLLLASGETGFEIKAYKPVVTRHDRMFIPPPNMVTAGYTAIAHYHFHVQQHDNVRYASPGQGDRQNIADRQRLNGIVLTFIDPHTLNVDFYRHGGVVIDLGTLRR